MNEPIHERYGHDTIIPPREPDTVIPEAPPTLKMPVAEIAQLLFDNRVGSLVLDNKYHLMQVLQHPEYREAKHDLIATVGPEEADGIMDQFFYNNRALFHPRGS